MKLKRFIPVIIFILAIVVVSSFTFNNGISDHGLRYSGKLHTISTRTADDLKDFFTYADDRLPLVTAHRGGPGKGFPENCIATFEHTLSYTPALLEIDPHYTKDSAIVLMHDPTLDRTTNGHGKVSDHTLAEIKSLRLKDTEGRLTPYQVPTLDEALQWAIGKTILVIDAKDVPIEVRAKRVTENKAQANAILISYSLEDTKKCYQISKDMVMEVMMGKIEDVTAFDKSGVPWESIVAFVSHQLPESKAVFDAVHQRKAMCILGSYRNYDRQYIAGEISKQELMNGYKWLIHYGADIIEADLAIDAGEALRPMQEPQSSKKKYLTVK